MNAAPQWITPVQFANLTGYSQKMIQGNIDKGYWPEGSVWCYTPDGDQVFNLDRFNQWVEGKV